MKFLIYIFYLYLFTTCSFSNKRLENALEFAENNRSELEKVLEYYKNDPEKLKVAKFLIENMPRYYSYDKCWQIDSIKSVLAEEVEKKHLYALSSLIIDKERIEKWNKFSYQNCRKVYDAHVITADYLIENIELSFLVWKKYPWNRKLSFEDFCELILPYRIGDEPLENWRKQYHEYYSHLLDSLYIGSDVIEACDSIAQFLNNKGFVQTKDFTLPHLGANFLFNNQVGYCRDACDHFIYVMRSIGIPIAMDFYFYSPENRLGHSWNVIRDTTGQFLLTGYHVFDNKRKTRDDGRKKGKVYRSCFGLQKELLKGITFNQSIPPRFRNSYIKDVTSYYIKNNTLEINLNFPYDKYAFLSVFTINGWSPIDIGEIKKGKAAFRNVEDNLIYQIESIDKDGFSISGHPFLFHHNTISYFIPDTNNKTEITLKRKYPLRFYTVISLNENMIGSTIWGSNDIALKNAELLYEVKDSIFVNRNIITFNNIPQYRYIHYQSPEGKPIELAEFCVYDNINSERPLGISIVNPFVSVHPTRNDFNVSNIIDGDPLSFSISKDTSIHLTFDLGRQSQIEKIMFVPRNDENFIWPGDKYELFFHNGTAGWESLGIQTAESNELIYRVPENALFWLRNHTRGQEEQIFYIKEGKQIFTQDISDKNF